MADPYRLSDSELDRIFDRVAGPALFRTAVAADEPLLILVGAQPGAGKTRAGIDAIRESGERVVRIIGDDLRKFHPAYRQLLSKHPAAMPDATAQASGTWVEKAVRYAAEHRISTLVEGTWRDPAVALRTAQMFSAAGFRVDAHLVAVSPEQSHLSTAMRFIEDERQNGEARFTKVEAHDIAFAGIPKTIRELCAAGSPVDRLVVRTRDSVIFDRPRSKGRSIRGATVKARGEWNRPLSNEEFETWTQRADEVASYFDLWHQDDSDAKDLVRQLGYDRKYLGLVRAGAVAVRGHARTGGDVVPHSRGFPRG